ncbi:MAG: hypothetical protein HQ530_04075 [Parcubacteria group bacterium]|nr:hypothetical protein [Parcubacteria group bacterium]
MAKTRFDKIWWPEFWKAVMSLMNIYHHGKIGKDNIASEIERVVCLEARAEGIEISRIHVSVREQPDNLEIAVLAQCFEPGNIIHKKTINLVAYPDKVLSSSETMSHDTSPRLQRVAMS